MYFFVLSVSWRINHKYAFLARSIVNVDCLLDAVQALVSDCDHPAIRKIKNIDAFVNRCKWCSEIYVANVACLYNGV